MAQQTQTGQDNGVLIMCHTLPGQQQKSLSLTHEEVDWTLDETVQDVGVVGVWDHTLHQDNLTLNEPEEDVASYHERNATFQWLLP